MNEVGSADAATLMKALESNMSDLSKCLRNDNKGFSKLITSIMSTMSDQGATNPVFNRQLEELRETLLPNAIENWDEIPEINRLEIVKVSSFFAKCMLHYLNKLHVTSASRWCI